MSAFEQLLAGCGVTPQTLTPAETDALDRRGYVVLPEVVDGSWMELLRSAFESACGRGGPAGRDETGTRHPTDLLGTDPVFERVLTHARVLAAAHHVLRRPFQLLFLSGRDPLPGFGQQGLHTDWTARAARDPFDVVTALWMLDDFTGANGATRVIPGSQVVPRPLPKSMQAPQARHPDQQLVLAPAGSVLVLNGHLWHSGTRNCSAGPRRALQCQWVARDRARAGTARQAQPGRLGAAVRALLGS